MMPPVSISSKAAAAMRGFALNAVAGDAGLVADDGAAIPQNGVEQSRFAGVGAADDDH